MEEVRGLYVRLNVSMVVLTAIFVAVNVKLDQFSRMLYIISLT